MSSLGTKETGRGGNPAEVCASLLHLINIGQSGRRVTDGKETSYERKENFLDAFKMEKSGIQIKSYRKEGFNGNIINVL